jgi:hypothetical protein
MRSQERCGPVEGGSDNLLTARFCGVKLQVPKPSIHLTHLLLLPPHTFFTNICKFIEKILTLASTTLQEATTISQLSIPTPTMTQLPEAQLAEPVSVTPDDPDVPKTRKAFVPLGSYPPQSCSGPF